MFGRGGEEMDFLQQQGIQVKVIPGTTHECQLFNCNQYSIVICVCVCIQRFVFHGSSSCNQCNRPYLLGKAFVAVVCKQ